MKIRTGFVSNSSTQSFVCPLCDDLYLLMDGDPETNTYALCICKNHHAFCQVHIPFSVEEITKVMKEELKKNPPDAVIPSHIKKKIDKLSLRELKELFDRKNEDKKTAMEMNDFIHYFFRNLPTKLCPICTFKRILPCDVKDYFFITAEMDTVLNNIQKTFGTYKKFQKFLDTNRNQNLDWDENED
ncbi:MAG: hypothetical protein ACTSSP_00250 [Candidatus Asgardarchaeia archaeon]